MVTLREGTMSHETVHRLVSFRRDGTTMPGGQHAVPDMDETVPQVTVPQERGHSLPTTQKTRPNRKSQEPFSVPPAARTTQPGQPPPRTAPSHPARHPSATPGGDGTAPSPPAEPCGAPARHARNAAHETRHPATQRAQRTRRPRNATTRPRDGAREPPPGGEHLSMRSRRCGGGCAVACTIGAGDRGWSPANASRHRETGRGVRACQSATAAAGRWDRPLGTHKGETDVFDSTHGDRVVRLGPRLRACASSDG